MRQKVKIGINTLFMIPGKVGGTENFLVETLRVLARSDRAAYTLFTNRENHDYLAGIFTKGDRVRLERLDFRAENRYQRIIREQYQLPKRIKKAECDVLWSPGYTACLRAPCPQAVTIHDVQYRRFPQDLSPLGLLTTRFLVGRSARNCQAIMTLTEFSKNEIIHFLNIDAGKVTVTGAAASNRIVPASADLESDSRSTLLCVANSYPHKDLDLLVRVFDRLADRHPCELRLVCRPGRAEGTLLRALSGCRHRERVDRHFHLPPSKLAGLFAEADVFVLPSRYEGFGLPLIEALGAGVPAVAARAAALPEVGGDAPIYFDPGSEEGLLVALEAALELSPKERGMIVRRGIERAAEFTWGKTAAVVEEVLLGLA